GSVSKGVASHARAPPQSSQYSPPEVWANSASARALRVGMQIRQITGPADCENSVASRSLDQSACDSSISTRLIDERNRFASAIARASAEGPKPSTRSNVRDDAPSVAGKYAAADTAAVERSACVITSNARATSSLSTSSVSEVRGNGRTFSVISV